jgi:hypothetical protein
MSPLRFLVFLGAWGLPIHGNEDEDAADDNDEKIYWTRAIGLIHLWYLLIMSQLWGIYGFYRGYHWLLLFQLSVNLVSEFKCCSASQGVFRQGILDVADEGCACILFFILSVSVPRYHQTTFLRDQPDGKGLWVEFLFIASGEEGI